MATRGLDHEVGGKYVGRWESSAVLLLSVSLVTTAGPVVVHLIKSSYKPSIKPSKPFTEPYRTRTLGDQYLDTRT